MLSYIISTAISSLPAARFILFFARLTLVALGAQSGPSGRRGGEGWCTATGISCHLASHTANNHSTHEAEEETERIESHRIAEHNAKDHAKDHAATWGYFFRAPEVVGMRARHHSQAQQLNMLLPLALAVWQHVQGLDFLPAVTLAALGANAYVFLQTAGRRALTHSLCLSASKVLSQGNWLVLLSSTFTHGDQMHLYYNALSFLHKGVQLERLLGAQGFALLLAQCCALTPLLYVALEVVGSSLAPQLFQLKDCAVGFSGVIFALKVVCQHHFPAAGAVMGLPLPPHLLAWGELVAISLVSPNASFVGHMAGILCGLACVHSGSALSLLGLQRWAAWGGRRLVGGRLV